MAAEIRRITRSKSWLAEEKVNAVKQVAVRVYDKNTEVEAKIALPDWHHSGNYHVHFEVKTRDLKALRHCLNALHEEGHL